MRDDDDNDDDDDFHSRLISEISFNCFWSTPGEKEEQFNGWMTVGAGVQ